MKCMYVIRASILFKKKKKDLEIENTIRIQIHFFPDLNLSE